MKFGEHRDCDGLCQHPGRVQGIGRHSAACEQHVARGSGIRQTADAMKELALETFFSADEQTADILRRLHS